MKEDESGAFIKARHDPNHIWRLSCMVKLGVFARTLTGRSLIYQLPEPLSEIAEIPPRWMRNQIAEWIESGHVVDNYRRPFAIWQKERTYLAVLCQSRSGEQLHEQLWEERCRRRTQSGR